ncbi:MAG: Fic family protein [Candidatus Fibromonas sp.]|nr:Fic family protein [Candidatus Fibromonas sp.]
MLRIRDIEVTPQMLSVISELDAFKATWTGFSALQPEQLKKLKKISTIESVGSSNRIEGNKLSDEEVEQLLSRIQKKSFKNRDEEEIAGYAELMNLIFDSYEVIPLTENYIKHLHKILLQFCKGDSSHRGEYKKLSNSVSAFDAGGKEIGVVFETASLFKTPMLMEELVAWTRKNLDDGFYHPLLTTGIFVVHFLAIHPFQDGNGRLSRALTTMLLLKKGYDYVPYSSIESIIEANKDGYYRALRRTQKTLGTKKASYEPWFNFFLTTLQKQKRHLEEKIKSFKKYDTGLSKLATNILELLDEHLQLTVAKAAEILNVKPDTVKKSMKNLVDKGYLLKRGSTKGAWYEKRTA